MSIVNDALNNIGKAAGNIFGGAVNAVENSRFNLPAQINATTQYFTNPNSFGGNNFARSPVMQQASNVQNFIQSNQQFKPIPTIHPFQEQDNSRVGVKQNFLPQIGNTIANIPGGFVNTIVGQGVVDPALDIGRLAGARLTGQNIPTYGALKSAPVRLAYNIMGEQATPQQVIGNTAESLLPAATAYGGGKVFGIGKQAAGEAAKQTLLNVTKTGAINGLETGGIYGILNGLAQGRNDTLKGQLTSGAVQGATGAVTGGVFGGGVAAAGYGIGALKNKLASPEQNVIDKFKQVGMKGLDPEEKQLLMGMDLNSLNAMTKGVTSEQLTNSEAAKAGVKTAAQLGQDPAALQAQIDQAPQSLWDKAQQGFVDFTAPIGGTKEPATQKDLVDAVKSGNITLNEAQAMGLDRANAVQTNPNPFEKGVPNDPIPGSAAENPQEIARQARLAHSAMNTQIRTRAENFATQAKATLTSLEDNELFRQAQEHPDAQEWLASQSSDPGKFNALVNNYQKFTDYVAASAKDQKVPLNNVQDYYTHIIDLKSPEDKQALDDFIAKNAKNFTSGFTKERYFANIDELRNAGFKLLNESSEQGVAQDAVAYANSMAKQISASAYNNTINALRPGGAVAMKEAGTVPYNYQGKLFQQSNVPGNQGTFIDPEIEQYQQHYNRSAFADNPVIAGKDVQIGDQTVHIPGIDKVNQILKETKLALGGFHGLNTTLRQAVNDPTAIPQAVQNMFSPTARAAFNQQAIDDGVIDYGAKLGVTFDVSGDVLPQDASFMDTINAKNPVAKFNNALFGGMINTYKVNLARSMMDKFPDALTNPEQAAQAQAYSAQINNLMGGLNYEALGRNKSVQQAFRLVALAPDFNEGILRQLTTAINPTQYANDATRPAAIFALRNVIGQVVLLAGLAELGRKVTSGNFSPDFKSFVQNSVLKSQIPLPNSPMFNNPKNGKTQVASLPSTEGQALIGSVTDPLHFLQARGSSALSLAGSIASGKDYYGNPLVNPWNGTPDTLSNRVKAALPNQLPIPVQQVMKVTGKNATQTPADAALNIAGLRVSNNPNDPKVASQKVYFDNLDKAAATLNPNDQKIFLGQIHPTTKDPEGNSVIDNNSIDTVANYSTLLNNPKLMSAEVAFQQSNPNHDPLWDLPDNQRNLVMASSVKLPNQKNTYSTLLQQQPWYQPFQAARSQFYASLPPSQTPQTAGGMTRPAPSAYVQQQMDAKNWSDPQVKAYLDANTLYNNNRLTDMGLPPINNSFGGSGGGYGGGGGGSAISLAKRMTGMTSPQKVLRQARSKVVRYRPHTTVKGKIKVKASSPKLKIRGLKTSNKKVL